MLPAVFEPLVILLGVYEIHNRVLRRWLVREFEWLFKVAVEPVWMIMPVLRPIGTFLIVKIALLNIKTTGSGDSGEVVPL